MTYKAKVITVGAVDPHPNAQRLQLLRWNGYTFVVGLDTKPGDLMVIFLADGQLSHDFCSHNNLYRDATKNKDTSKTGYFEDDRRVRAQPFRGVKSDGFACDLSYISYCGDTKSLVDGLEFDEVNGKVVCNKYVTEATRKAMSIGKAKKHSETTIYLAKHYDTEQLGMVLDSLPTRALYIFTEKMHGTSGRTGFVKVETEKYSWLAKIVNTVFKRRVIKPVVEVKYDHVSGTRNTICNDRDDVKMIDGKEHYRWIVHQNIAPLLRKGETVFYEIVGFDTYGSSIMNQQNLDAIQDKVARNELLKRFFPISIPGEKGSRNITYRYGCNCVTENGKTPAFDVYVYRMTIQNECGDVQELPWFEVERRCAEMGLKTVPVIGLDLIIGGQEFVTKTVMRRVIDTLDKDPCSTVDSGHLMEGVVVRVECNQYIKAYKAKGWAFMVLEGIVKEDPNVVDVEEAS